MFPLLYLFGDGAFLALRAALGAILIVHGVPKFKNLKATGENFAMMGFRPGGFWAFVVAFVEFVGGIALLLGFYTQVVAAFVAVEFAVITIWKIAKKQQFVGGLELDLIILAVALTLLTAGAGAISLDHYFFFGGF